MGHEELKEVVSGLKDEKLANGCEIENLHQELSALQRSSTEMLEEYQRELEEAKLKLRELSHDYQQMGEKKDVHEARGNDNHCRLMESLDQLRHEKECGDNLRHELDRMTDVKTKMSLQIERLQIDNVNLEEKFNDLLQRVGTEGTTKQLHQRIADLDLMLRHKDDELKLTQAKLIDSVMGPSVRRMTSPHPAERMSQQRPDDLDLQTSYLRLRDSMNRQERLGNLSERLNHLEREKTMLQRTLEAEVKCP